MQEPSSRSRSRYGRPSTNGVGARSEPVDPVDRSDLLRRAHRFPFVLGDEGLDGIRLRRSRRVFGSFSGIARLARKVDR